MTIVIVGIIGFFIKENLAQSNKLKANIAFNQVLENLENILAIELMFGAQGLEFRRPAKCSKFVENTYDLIRSKVAKLEDDRLIGDDILAIADLINNRKFITN